MNIEYRDTYLADGCHNAMLKFPTAGVPGCPSYTRWNLTCGGC
jgi:hypothetical protein